MSTPLFAQLTVTDQKLAAPVSPRVFGNFMEHLGYSTDGGVLAHALANPVFERDANLNDRQVNALLEAGRLLVDYYRAGLDPRVFPEHWSPGIGATGFGVSALDDYRRERIPFPWAPLGPAGCVSASLGRIGGAVRLRGLGTAPEESSAGVRQGIFLPFQRCLAYEGHLWVRIATQEARARGQVQVGLRRRLDDPQRGRAAGELLAADTRQVNGCDWQKLPFQVHLAEGQVSPGEPVDFFIRWLPGDPAGALDLLVDQAVLLPADAVEGLFDPDVLRLVREWNVPLLRWPGGNFVSYYHWRDGTGPLDRRPTRRNDAWGGLEYHWMGTVEFLRFCRLVGAEPHITVNTGTGTPEEAAAWVEFCNGPASSPMGRLRAWQGAPQPCGVKLWEVGNETYGCWQGGYHGAEENALRFCEFEAAMRAVDPAIELIATGSQFDIAEPGPALDHTHADRRWNRLLLQDNAGQMDYLSLHCLPANDVLLDGLSEEEACYSLLAQPLSWERFFLPDLACLIDQMTPPGRPPARVAITEWGVLGPRGSTRPVVENYGEVPYAGLFLNMAIRLSGLVQVCNATALLHGGCIRKAGGQVFYDPQYTVIQAYSRLAGGLPLVCQVESPGYVAPVAPDLGLPLQNVPYVDAAAVQMPDGSETACLVNRHRHAPARVVVTWDGGPPGEVRFTCLSDPDITARARLGEKDRFQVEERPVEQTGSEIAILLPPCSVGWLHRNKPL